MLVVLLHPHSSCNSPFNKLATSHQGAAVQKEKRKFLFKFSNTCTSVGDGQLVKKKNELLCIFLIVLELITIIKLKSESGVLLYKKRVGAKSLPMGSSSQHVSTTVTLQILKVTGRMLCLRRNMITTN